jgi:hypothetical protein
LQNIHTCSSTELSVVAQRQSLQYVEITQHRFDAESSGHPFTCILVDLDGWPPLLLRFVWMILMNFLTISDVSLTIRGIFLGSAVATSAGKMPNKSK